jgi:hypothetical protein
MAMSCAYAIFQEEDAKKEEKEKKRAALAEKVRVCWVPSHIQYLTC